MWALHERHNNSELRENQVKDDLKSSFKDDLAFSKKHYPFTKKMREKGGSGIFAKELFPSQRRRGKSRCI